MNNSIGGPGPVGGAGAGQMGQMPGQRQAQMGMNPMGMGRMPMGPDQVSGHESDVVLKSGTSLLCMFCFAEVLLKSCSGQWNPELLHPGELSLEVLNPHKLSSVTCDTEHLKRCGLTGELWWELHAPMPRSCPAGRPAGLRYNRLWLHFTWRLLCGTKIDAILLHLYRLIRDSMPSPL